MLRFHFIWLVLLSVHLCGISYAMTPRHQMPQRCEKETPIMPDLEELYIVKRSIIPENITYISHSTNSNGPALYKRQNSLNIPIHFTVVCGNDGSSFCANEQLINNQYAVLTESFAKYGINFELGTVKVIQNDEFHAKPLVENGRFSTSRLQLVSHTREGVRKKDLNVFVVEIPGQKVQGVNNIKANELSDTLDWYDGVMIDFRTLPGIENFYSGDILEDYKEGKTLVHEVGHWMGLLHTFHGGCLGRDILDVPDDTNPEEDFSDSLNSWQYYNCQPRSSCGSPDLIDNFMNYSPDSCMGSFTPGQVQQMQFSYQKYRNNQGDIVVESRPDPAQARITLSRENI